MLCRHCNTPLDEGKRTCPACGRVTQGSGLTYRIARKNSPSPPRSLAEGPGRAPAELELYDEVDLERTRAAEEIAADGPGQPASNAPAFALLTLDSTELRARVAEHPELIESRLSVFVDAQGRPVGAGYSTEVGEIDLLARDANGGLVVVMVAERGRPGDPVAEILQRIGWVRKHLGGEGPPVRGVVLLEPPLGDLSYAAAAVAGTVSFKTYRVALQFEDVVL